MFFGLFGYNDELKCFMHSCAFEYFSWEEGWRKFVCAFGSGICLPHRRNMNHFNQCNAIFTFLFRLGVVACACNPAALEVGVGGSLASGSSVCRRSMAIGRPR